MKYGKRKAKIFSEQRGFVFLRSTLAGEKRYPGGHTSASQRVRVRLTASASMPSFRRRAAYHTVPSSAAAPARAVSASGTAKSATDTVSPSAGR